MVIGSMSGAIGGWPFVQIQPFLEKAVQQNGFDITIDTIGNCAHFSPNHIG